MAKTRVRLEKERAGRRVSVVVAALPSGDVDGERTPRGEMISSSAASLPRRLEKERAGRRVSVVVAALPSDDVDGERTPRGETISSPAAPVPQRVCLVTGANKGIGKEIARKLGSLDDVTCILGCRDERLGTAAAAELKAAGCNVDFVRLDLADEDTVEAARNSIEREYGRLDVLVNNAAVCYNDATLYGKVPFAPFEVQADVTIRTNFFGTLAVTRAMLPLLRASPSPRIVNIASSAGRLAILRSQDRVDAFTSPDLQMEELEGLMREFVADAQDGTHADKGWPNTGYGVSKVGIIAMTKVLARNELNIMVNSVDPGYCATDQNNNQGYIPAERGARTPFLLATLPANDFYSAVHWYEEKEIKW